mgnify:CR=1 FL=1
MQTPAYVKSVLFLSIAGVLFSGYLSGIKLFTATCAFNESCPIFLGYPACFFGFGMFLVLFVAALFAVLKENSRRTAVKVVASMSALGILFAGYLSMPEIKSLLAGAETGYTLGLPTCVYGLVFYILIFILAVLNLTAKNRN